MKKNQAYLIEVSDENAYFETLQTQNFEPLIFYINYNNLLQLLLKKIVLKTGGLQEKYFLTILQLGIIYFFPHLIIKVTVFPECFIFN